MAKRTKPASFEDFLQAPSRLAEHAAGKANHAAGKARHAKAKSGTIDPGAALPPHNAGAHQAPAKKEKVGLTIDPEIVEAIDDYIYRERKQGRRLKKNDVYEAALRQFLGLEGNDAR